jgi:hypothetical protein
MRRIQFIVKTGGEPPFMLAYREERDCDLPDVLNTLAALPNVGTPSILQSEGETWLTFLDFLRRVQAAQDLLANGWTVQKVSMYDEEGVEGWQWTAPDGREENVIGDWEGAPPVPPEIAKAHNETVGRKDFATFLNSLLIK